MAAPFLEGCFFGWGNGGGGSVFGGKMLLIGRVVVSRWLFVSQIIFNRKEGKRDVAVSRGKGLELFRGAVLGI